MDMHSISISRRRWKRLVRQLAERGEGRRESGAFLLAKPGKRNRRVVGWVLFDDLDPESLNGSVSIRGQAFARLWSICRERGMKVIADVHTHPGRGVGQSSIDAANPMVAQRGHVGLIVPSFARGRVRTRDVGFHVYRGDRSWDAFHEDEAAERLRLTWL
jgi:proteasome lid subunit RPN8/RPN11